MMKGLIRASLVSMVGLLSAPAFAQGGMAPGGGLNVQQGPDGRVMINGVDMQQLGQSLQQSIQQSGVDINQMRQEMQNGTFDPSKYQDQINQIRNTMSQQLGVDLNQLQNRMQNANLDNLKQQLEATDQEWAVLLPKIQKLLTARNNAPSSSGNMMSRAMSMGMGNRNQTTTPLQKTDSELRTLLGDANTSNAVISAKLNDYRAACDQANKELNTAEKDLADLLTPRQEAIMVNLGYMK
jgi:chromosome segregation ATPase